MNQYEKLDQLILAAVKARTSPLYGREVNVEAERIAAETGREGFRVIDARLQALRRKGSIAYSNKARDNGAGGWELVPENPVNG